MVNTPHDPQHSNNQYASDGAQSAETNSISGQESLGKSLSASLGGNIRRTESGHVDVLHAIGGWRGHRISSVIEVFRHISGFRLPEYVRGVGRGRTAVLEG